MKILINEDNMYCTKDCYIDLDYLTIIVFFISFLIFRVLLGKKSTIKKKVSLYDIKLEYDDELFKGF